MAQSDPQSPAPLHGLLAPVTPREHPHESPHAHDEPASFAWIAPWALLAVGVLATLLLAGCATPSERPRTLAQPALLPEVRDALAAPATPRPPALPPAVAQALVPPADLSMPPLPRVAPEPRFDLNVVSLPVAQVFAALAKDTRYSMLVDPELKGSVTVNLKDVTLLEALETLREMYGFEYRVQGTRVFVQAAALSTRVFQVNYLLANRTGRSDVRVTSGSIAQATGAQTAGGAGGAPAPAAGGGAAAPESSRITTQSRNDFWPELESALKLLIGERDGRQVVVSPQSGVVVVRAMPAELRAIEQYLRAARLSIERQVMLEAKIIDVRLRESFQTGINWAAFTSGGNHRGGAGLLTPGSQLGTSGNLTGGALTANPGSTLALGPTATSGLFGLAFQTSNFAALLSFLETQGDVQVLSSPRIATLNNQKAVLKVGTDEFFVTSVSTTTNSTAGGSTTSPTITVQPFFSGIALDVTPQIDEDGNIILHVHPSVSSVAERTKVLNLGSLGNFTLPLAASTVSETDTIVRARDGNIVAIGGLMKTARSSERAQLPGVGSAPVVGGLFGSRASELDKHELVILLKPTVIHSDAQMDALRTESLQRLDQLTAAPRALP
jgi:MSHA biogenesis protein MshL